MALSIKPYIENKERIHLIGIGGVSMNSLGELLLSRGVPVSGSDRLRTDVTARLEALGAKIIYEHKPENVAVHRQRYRDHGTGKEIPLRGFLRPR